MASFFQRVVDQFRNIRRSLGFGGKTLSYGGIYRIKYNRWKHDPEPFIFVMYSDAQYTHGLNTNYLNTSDKQWLARTIYLVNKGAQNIDGRAFYQLLKRSRMSIVKTCYRMYITKEIPKADLVSAGFTAMYNAIYTNHTKGWIHDLNKILEPSDMKNVPPKISFSSTELQERVIMAQNAVPLQQQRVSTPTQQNVFNQGNVFNRRNPFQR